MNRKLYVGNLSFDATEDQVKDLFGAYGEVQEVKLIADRYTGRPRGFAFVSFATPEAAGQAMEALNGQEHQGRNLAIDFARSETNERSGGGGGNRGGGGGERRERSSSFRGNKGPRSYSN